MYQRILQHQRRFDPADSYEPGINWLEMPWLIGYIPAGQ
jgi:hypothetical protein